MKLSDFYFELPEHLIAQEPPLERGLSRLLLMDRLMGKRTHSEVLQLPEILCGENFLSPNGEKPLLVFNDTKVRKARIFAKNDQTGAEAEFLLLEQVNDKTWKAIVKRKQRKKTGSIYIFYDDKQKEISRAQVKGHEEENLLLEFDNIINEDFFEKCGHIPLPPYIKRKDTPSDAQRYQTIYAKSSGSAAAPTAGLHFTQELLDSLKENGIDSAFVTLHVGLGTFLPVRCQNIQDHQMHEEQFIITEENAAIIESAILNKRKIVAVGTTSLRSLESAITYNENGDINLKRGWQSTSIFIYPGFSFKIVNALFTNFHTPESTLLMLVSAFAGRDFILESYAEAVREQYRFFSYGDATLIY